MTALKIFSMAAGGSLIGLVLGAVIEDDELLIVRGMVGGMLGGIAGMTVGSVVFTH